MKVSELSRRARVPVPTIKFYLREGLLPGGATTGRNQADYSEAHLERLELIRALKEEAGLSLETIARCLRAADANKRHFVTAAIDAIERYSGRPVDARSAAYRSAVSQVAAVCRKRGWNVSARDASVKDAARALCAIQRSFPYTDDERTLRAYFDAAELLAQNEVPEGWTPEDAPAGSLRFAILGTVLFEPFLLALRRAAHVSRTRSTP
jgi:DNA-binding transcriptional MerR regulator